MNITKCKNIDMKTVAERGICTLCPACSMNTRSHYLHNKLIISYCECNNMGGLYVGFSNEPYWKLYTDMKMDDFMEFAQSAKAYVDTMRELHVQSASS